MPRKKTYTPLGAVVAAAEAEHMSYGEYVAREERHAYISARKPNKPSAWVHPNRTIFEGLDKELTHLDSRAEWLMDSRAKEKLMEQQAQREANRIAEQRVCTFLEATETALRKAGKI